MPEAEGGNVIKIRRTSTKRWACDGKYGGVLGYDSPASAIWAYLAMRSRMREQT